MSKKADQRLASLTASLAKKTDQTTPTKAKPKGQLLQRENTLNRLASGKRRNVAQFMHPPNRIKMWADHNRDYDRLSVERCADLIEGFQRTGRQEFPAIVRKIDEPDYDYEVICGARRHWTARHMEWDLLIEVRDLTDRHAFILQDLENRDREDISDYERALDYKNALPKYFEGNRKHMAKVLEIDPSNFAKFLDLAEIPSKLVSLYSDVRELKVHHATAYKRLLSDPATKKSVMTVMRSLKGKGLPGRKIFAEIKKSGKPTAVSAKTTHYGNLTIQNGTKGPSKISLPPKPRDAAGQKELADTLQKNFQAFLKDWLSN